jgi:hypothetical protein
MADDLAMFFVVTVTKAFAARATGYAAPFGAARDDAPGEKIAGNCRRSG